MSEAVYRQKMQSVGIDFSNVWPWLQKLAPYLQEILIAILTHSANIPTPNAQAAPLDMAKVQSIATTYGFDFSAFQKFLQSISPFIAQLVIDILGGNVVQQQHSNP